MWKKEQELSRVQIPGPASLLPEGLPQGHPALHPVDRHQQVPAVRALQAGLLGHASGRLEGRGQGLQGVLQLRQRGESRWFVYMRVYLNRYAPFG